MKVNGVLGPLTRDNLGVITPHEHSFEYIPVEDMERCVDMLVGIFTSEMLVK